MTSSNLAPTPSEESIQFDRFEIFSNENSDQSIDLRGGAPTLEYRESVFMPYVDISAGIIDTGEVIDADDGSGSSINLLESIKCQGTEKIKFKIRDYRGGTIDLTRNDDLRVSRTSNIKQGSKNVSFVLESVSKTAFENTLLENRCIGKFDGKISDIAEEIITDNLKSAKTPDIDVTYNTFHMQGEARYPLEVLTELQRLSIPIYYNAPGKMAGYLCWQTSTGFKFKSLDRLFSQTGKTIKRYIDNKQAHDRLPPGFDGKILDSTINRTTDALSQFESGAYGTEISVFDHTTNTYTTSDPLISADRGNGIIAASTLPKVNPEFEDKVTVHYRAHAAKGQTFAAGDSLANQVEKFDDENLVVEQIYQQSYQNYRQKFNMSAEIIIAADLSLHAGDLVYCDFPEISNKATPVSSRKDSGIYMIADLCHYANTTKSFTGLHLVRDSYGTPRS